MDDTEESPGAEWVLPADPASNSAAASGPSMQKWWRTPRGATAVRGGLLLVVGLVLGGGIAVAADQHGSSSSASARHGMRMFNGGVGVPGGGGPRGGYPSGGPGRGQIPIGGLRGEQHIRGTVTARSATSISVKSSSGTATYTVTSSTQIVRNGRMATLAAVAVGDPVQVHVYPSGGKLLVERIFAGSSAPAPMPGSPGGFGTHDGGPGRHGWPDDESGVPGN